MKEKIKQSITDAQRFLKAKMVVGKVLLCSNFPYLLNTGTWKDPRIICEDLYDQKRIFTASTCLMGLSSLRELNI